MTDITFCLGVVVLLALVELTTAYISISSYIAYMEAKEFQKAQTKAKKPEHSRVNILV